MKQTPFMSILLYYLCLICCNNIQCIRVSYFDAVKLCAEKGGLASYSYFPRMKVSLTYYGHPHASVLFSQLKDVDLKDGESAWVAGYAKYGGIFLSNGCHTDELQTVTASSENSEDLGFHQCSHYCEKQDSAFTGMSLNRSSCSCIGHIHFSTIKSVKCPNNHEDTRVFELFFRRTKHNRHKYQCSLLRLAFFGRRDYEPSKCLGKNRLVCWFSTKIKIYSLPYLTTWPDGNKECNREGASLFSEDKTIHNNMEYGQYWTGYISAYTVTTEVQKGDACLAVTRLGDQLLMEPDDCEAKLSFICASDIIHNTTAFSYDNNTVSYDDNNIALSYDNNTASSNDNNTTFFDENNTSLSFDNTASSQNMLSIIQTTATLDSKVFHQPSAVVFNIYLVVITSCITLVAVAAITASVRIVLHKRFNTERRRINTDQFPQSHTIIENPIGVVEDHVYATVDEIGNARTDENVESNQSKSNNWTEDANLVSTSEYLTVVGENDAITLGRFVHCLENTATNINRDNTSVEQNANSFRSGETSIKIPVTTSNNASAYKTDHRYDDTSWYEQLTGKKGASYDCALQGPENQGPLMATAKAVNKDQQPDAALETHQLDIQYMRKSIEGRGASRCSEDVQLHEQHYIQEQHEVDVFGGSRASVECET